MSLGLFIPIAVMTAFWGIVGIIGPFCVPKSPNREYVLSDLLSFRLWRFSIVLTAICCYLLYVIYTYHDFFSWLIFYLAQWHPFYGPALPPETIRVIMLEWKVCLLRRHIFVVFITFLVICFNLISFPYSLNGKQRRHTYIFHFII